MIYTEDDNKKVPILEEALGNDLRKTYGLNILFGDKKKDPHVTGWNKWCGSKQQSDEEVIEIFNKRKDAFINYGFVVGHGGLIALDFDWEWVYLRAKDKHLSIIEGTFTARTPNYGYRVLAICPDYDVNNSKYKNTVRFDIFGGKHYAACYGKALREDGTVGEYKPLYEEKIKTVDSLSGLEEFLEDTLKKYDFLTYPCISSFFDNYKKWINLTHEQRLAISNLILQKGISVDEAQQFFMMCLDYDESKSRYQCEDTKQKIKNEGLHPPTCESLKDAFRYDGNKCKYCPRKNEKHGLDESPQVRNNTEKNTAEYLEDEEETAETYLPPVDIPPLDFQLQNNMISDYMACMTERTDAYSEYHFAVICELISRTIDGMVFIDFTQGTVYPNLWITMLGNSTTSRKTTTTEFGKKLKHTAVLMEEFDDTAFFLPNDFSPEALVEVLSNNPHGAIWVDEAAGFLASAKKRYMAGIIDILCTIYDGTSYHRTIRSKKGNEQTDFNIIDPYLSILFTTTPERFSESTNLIDLTSGFLARFLYVFPQYGKEWQAFEEASKENDDDFKKLAKALTKIQQTIRENGISRIYFASDALEYYQNWQKEKEQGAETRKDSIELATIGRLIIYAAKIAIIFTVAKYDFSKDSKITLSTIHEACRVIDTYFEPYSREIIEMAKRDEQNNLQEKILGTLRRRGGECTRRILLQHLHRSLNEVNTAIEALTESGEIGITEVNTSVNRTSTIIKLVGNDATVADVASVASVAYVDNDEENGCNTSNMCNISNTSNASNTSEDGNGDFGCECLCVCGESFGTVEESRMHKANCDKFQIKQSAEVRKILEDGELL